MNVRTLAAIALVLGLGNGLLAHEDSSRLEVGDQLIILMTDDLASEYAQCVGSLTAVDGIQLIVYGSLVQKMKDGRLRIKHTSSATSHGEKLQLVTLTAIVNPREIETDVTLAGMLASASPNVKPQKTTRAITTRRLKLSGLKGIKLRKWILSEEIGN